MKKRTLKKLLAGAMALALLLGMTGCGGSSGDSGNSSGGSSGDAGSSDVGGSGGAVTDTDVLGEKDQNVSYVMIFNPKIYDETLQLDNSSLSTGNFGLQIDTDAFRGGALDEETNQFLSLSQKDLNANLPKLELETSRGDVMSPSYSKGDTQEFFAFNTSMTQRVRTKFTCAFVGNSCYIWTVPGGITDAQAAEYGNEFDKNIYNQVTDTFGQARFTDNGGKVHLFFYPLMDSLGGCFYTFDLFAADEVTPADIQQYGINTNHAILHINSRMAGNPSCKTFQYSTMAHEFQHLICFTNYFSTSNYTMMRTWLNEAMSGYIEEKLYPGAQDEAGRYEEFLNSDLIRHGQSMYNFTTNTSSFSFDIGVYGSVYLFSEYLTNLAGNDIFSEIHDYWRTSYSLSLDEAEAIAKSVDATTYNKIDKTINFPDSISFSDAEEEWMSKLTLSFYLSLLEYDSSDPAAYQKVKAQALLYDEIDGTDIEGGGRVLLATKNGTFEIPEDAQDGLIYVGLDNNFRIVTDYVCR